MILTFYWNDRVRLRAKYSQSCEQFWIVDKKGKEDLKIFFRRVNLLYHSLLVFPQNPFPTFSLVTESPVFSWTHRAWNAMYSSDPFSAVCHVTELWSRISREVLLKGGGPLSFLPSLSCSLNIFYLYFYLCMLLL